MITVLIVDDQPLQRLGFRMLLETKPQGAPGWPLPGSPAMKV
jgi:DNA-binding NarL/FixJ family response regulator